ncbi:MAG: YceI family protein [Ginsengibacter sp.]|jgi:polyisoprenoid-binding protein YceI
MSLTKWSLDPMHSEITFKVKHLMISTVTGHFKKFSLIGETESDDFNTARKIEFSTEIDSIDTNNAQRDAHLKSADFFNAEQHPYITFTGSKYQGEGEDGKLSGELTIAGITKPVVLNVEFGGIIVDPYGQTKAGFTVSGKISRKDFGITYGSTLETGGVLLGDEIKINAEIQLVKQAVEELVEA